MASPRAIVLSLVAAVVCYIAGGFGGGLLVSVLSSNQHDRSVEAAMTGAFVAGPLAAVIGFLIAFRVLRGAGPTS